MNKEYPGVYKTKKKDNSEYYRVSVTYGGKHISLGSYLDIEVAAEAYRNALEILKQPEITLLDVTDNSGKFALDFEKSITLLNFRDNNIYFSNPLYISKKIIYYYLSPTEILKFDADEIFYYSSHKIMKRGGHLFVADYGRQVNIVSRYGIKNHAVLGRDYRFKNGDRLDFRVSNIEIFNVYQGVSKCKDRGQIKYRSVIHLNGNFTIGHYDTAEEAALAYNKAAAYLERHGIKTAFNKNEIHKLSKGKANEIYKKIKMPDSIKNYAKEYMKSHPME